MVVVSTGAMVILETSTAPGRSHKCNDGHHRPTGVLLDSQHYWYYYCCYGCYEVYENGYCSYYGCYLCGCYG